MENEDKIGLKWGRFSRRLGLGLVAILSAAFAAILPINDVALPSWAIALLALAPIPLALLALWPAPDEQDEIEMSLRLGSIAIAACICISIIIIATLIFQLTHIKPEALTPYALPGILIFTALSGEMAVRLYHSQDEAR